MGVYYIQKPDELYHYGVKGMKWGIRHDPEKSPRPLNNREKALSEGYQKKYKNISKNDADTEARRVARNKKLILLGAAAITGAALGYMAYSHHHRMVADNIIRAGHTMQTVHDHPELIQNGEKFYTAARLGDKWKYLSSFSSSRANPGTFKKRVTMKASQNIRVAGLRTGEKVYKELQATNSEFANETAGVSWRKFNTRHLLGAPSKSTNVYIDKLKSMGYDGVADINDRTGWKTEAHILFGNSKITDIKVHDVTAKEVQKATFGRAFVESAQGLATPTNAIIGGGYGALYATAKADKKSQERLRKLNRSKKRK